MSGKTPPSQGAPQLSPQQQSQAQQLGLDPQHLDRDRIRGILDFLIGLLLDRFLPGAGQPGQPTP